MTKTSTHWGEPHGKSQLLTLEVLCESRLEARNVQFSLNDLLKDFNFKLRLGKYCRAYRFKTKEWE